MVGTFYEEEKIGVWVRFPEAIRTDPSYAYVYVYPDTIVEMLLRGWDVATLRPSDALNSARLFTPEN